MILLDTNIISELVRPSPNPAVLAYIRMLLPETTFTAAVCEAEIVYGLARLPVGRRREDLAARIAALFASGFQNRVLPFDSLCASHYGAIRSVREASGRPMTVEDAMIAATARAHGAAVATRNVDDFKGCGTKIVNPWRPS